jgi:hypothetical protein
MTAIADSLQTFPADRVALFIHTESEQSYRESTTPPKSRSASACR